jgi:hypothetical protein
LDLLSLLSTLLLACPQLKDITIGLHPNSLEWNSSHVKLFLFMRVAQRARGFDTSAAAETYGNGVYFPPAEPPIPHSRHFPEAWVNPAVGAEGAFPSLRKLVLVYSPVVETIAFNGWLS